MSKIKGWKKHVDQNGSPFWVNEEFGETLSLRKKVIFFRQDTGGEWNEKFKTKGEAKKGIISFMKTRQIPMGLGSLEYGEKF